MAVYGRMYENFLDKFFHSGFRLRNENLDCANCLMAKKGIYKGDLKCCTYFPFLPNYSLGACIDYSSRFKEILKNKIKGREFVLPLGLMPSWSYRVAYRFKSSLDFGNREDLLCPFYVKSSGQCEIWPYRNSACSSFHCNFSGDERDAESYWNRYNETIHYLEMALSQYCMMAFGYTKDNVLRQIGYLEGHEKDLDPEVSSLSREEYRDLWGDYYQREEYFFIRVREFQKSIPYETYQEIGARP